MRYLASCIRQLRLKLLLLAPIVISACTKPLTMVYVGRSAYESEFDSVVSPCLDVVADQLSQATGLPIAYEERYLTERGGDADGEEGKSIKTIYRELMARDDVLVVIDGTWGRNIAHIVPSLDGGQLPVITINADRPEDEILESSPARGPESGSPPVLYLGHDEHARHALNAALADLAPDPRTSVMFIGERGWPASEVHWDELQKVYQGSESMFLPKVKRLASDKEPRPAHREVYRAVAKLKRRQKALEPDKPQYFVFAVHGAWGRELLPITRSMFPDACILAVASAVSESSRRQLGALEGGGKLIVQTYPAVLVPNAVHELAASAEGVSLSHVNSPKYVQHVADVGEILRWGLALGDSTERDRSLLRKRLVYAVRELTGQSTVVSSPQGAIRVRQTRPSRT